MKKLFFALVYLTVFVVIVSCQRPERTKSYNNANKTFAEMLSAMEKKSQVKDYTLSDTDFNCILAMEDTLIMRVQNDKEVAALQYNRTCGLLLMDLVMNSKTWKTRKSSIQYVEDVVNKNLELQFKFDVNERDGQIQLNLLNCFIPSYHKLPENSYGYCDSFDFYIYFDKKTKECTRINCTLPQICNGKDEMSFFVYVIKDPGSAEPIPLESPKLEYDKEYNIWIAEFNPSLINELQTCQSVYFMVGNKKDEMETSCINLSSFHEQYKKIMEQ